jgi:hypothetical protein
MKYQPLFPIKAIVKILKEESQSRFDGIRRNYYMDDMLQEVERKHYKHIDSLESYEQLNEYCNDYLRMSLQEWVESL